MKSYMVGVLLLVSGMAQALEADCVSPETTIEINICASREVEAAEAELARYLDKALEKYSSNVEVVEALQYSQEAWLIYLKSHCGVIYELWSGGTIRGSMYNGCMLSATKHRTHNIWSSFLTYMDSTPPMLPEPK